MQENVSSFADDTDTHCDFSIADHNSDTENTTDTHTCLVPKYPAIHSQRKHAYRNTFGDSHIQYHDFDNQILSHLETNTQHYYNKNYKTHTGIYMTQ